MEKRAYPFVTFVKYHNAVPVAVSFVLLLSGGAYAATNQDLQKAVYTETSVVHSVDNSYLLSTNLDTFPFRFSVTNVSEDGNNYYVSYTLRTLALVEYAWQDTIKNGMMTIGKRQLGSEDLGIYVERQATELRERERTVLRETQAYERNNGVSQKTIVTTYGGLVGKFIEPTSQTFQGYDPKTRSLSGFAALAVEDPEPLQTYDANAIVKQVNTLKERKGIPSLSLPPAGGSSEPPPAPLSEELGSTTTDSISESEPPLTPMPPPESDVPSEPPHAPAPEGEPIVAPTPEPPAPTP